MCTMIDCLFYCSKNFARVKVQLTVALSSIVAGTSVSNT